jgi:hypothetical protein
MGVTPALRAEEASVSEHIEHIEPAVQTDALARSGQHKILSFVLACMPGASVRREDALARLATLGPFKVTIRNGVAPLGTIVRRAPPARYEAVAEGRQRTGRVATLIDLFTSWEEGVATVRLDGESMTRTASGGAPVLVLERAGQCQSFRVTSHLIPVAPEQSAAVLDHVRALIGSGRQDPALSRWLVPMEGRLRADDRSIALGHATARHPVLLSVPVEMRERIAAPSVACRVDFPLSDPADVNSDRYVRLEARGLFAYYAFSAVGRHAHLLAVTVWPELCEYCLAFARPGRASDGNGSAPAGANSAGDARREILARSSVDTELTADSELFLARVGTRRITSTLREFGPQDRVRVVPRSQEASEDIMLVATSGEKRVELRLCSGSGVLRRVATISSSGMVAVSRRGLAFLSANDRAREDLVAALGPPEAGAEQDLAGVRFVVLPHGKSYRWAFPKDDESRARIAEYLNLDFRECAPPMLTEGDETALTMELAMPGSRYLKPFLKKLGEPEDYDGSVQRFYEVECFKRRYQAPNEHRKTGRPGVVWACRTEQLATLLELVKKRL